MKKSQWFSSENMPEIEGVYEVKSPWGSPGPWYAFFDGQSFGYRDCRGAKEAFESRHKPTSGIAPKWRGLAEDPNKKDEA